MIDRVSTRRDPVARRRTTGSRRMPRPTSASRRSRDPRTRALSRSRHGRRAALTGNTSSALESSTTVSFRSESTSLRPTPGVDRGHEPQPEAREPRGQHRAPAIIVRRRPRCARVLAHQLAVRDAGRRRRSRTPRRRRGVEVERREQVGEHVLDRDRLCEHANPPRGVTITGSRSTSARIISNESAARADHDRRPELDRRHAGCAQDPPRPPGGDARCGDSSSRDRARRGRRSAATPAPRAASAMIAAARRVEALERIRASPSRGSGSRRRRTAFEGAAHGSRRRGRRPPRPRGRPAPGSRPAGRARQRTPAPRSSSASEEASATRSRSRRPGGECTATSCTGAEVSGSQHQPAASSGEELYHVALYRCCTVRGDAGDEAADR